MGTMSGLNVKSVHFRFDKYTVFGMPLGAGAVLLTICEDVVEQGAVKLKEAGDTELQPMYDKFEDALAGAIGPVAGMIMQEYIDKWRGFGPAVSTRLS
ncbi:MAG: hypothetical protein OEL85_10640 [Desulfobulbaceae bacterium]|nr:hypothetical protein [Desulfobulbaceae bacterium]